MFFGLLRINEVLQIQYSWISFEDKWIQVNFASATKTWDDGFAYFIPNTFKGTFKKYVSQITEEGQTDESRFLQRYLKTEKRRRGPVMGKGLVEKWLQGSANILNMKKN